MWFDRKVVVMPAYNAQRTLEKTWREVVVQQVVDLVVIVDDASHDQTFSLARSIPGVVAHAHPRNMGYGAKQKTCYRLALEHGADIVVMVHPTTSTRRSCGSRMAPPAHWRKYASMPSPTKMSTPITDTPSAHTSGQNISCRKHSKPTVGSAAPQAGGAG